MTHIRPFTRWTRPILPLILVGLAAGGCASIRAHQAIQAEQILSAAGFVMKPADNPERLAELQKLAPRKVVRHMHDGQARYVYADPDTCKCLYVGDERQFQKYQELSLQKKIADEQLSAAEASRDASLDWGIGGPWWW
jgi:hypothetical protein